jgi:hypothetical protein
MYDRGQINYNARLTVILEILRVLLSRLLGSCGYFRFIYRVNQNFVTRYLPKLLTVNGRVALD